MPVKSLSPQEVLEKTKRYCTYQERCHKEVRDKLFSLGLNTSQVDEALSSLIVEGFLNEERFAKAFAGGKFRLKKWGRLRIVNELEKRGITKNCIRFGLAEIDEIDYRETLKKLLTSKSETSEEENLYVKRDKLSQYAIQKGYEPEIVWEVLKEILPDKTKR